MVAIIALAGTQHKVTTDDVLIVNRLKSVSEFAVGSIQTLTGYQVLLVTTSALTLVGMPFVPGAEVDVLVEEITRDAKVVIFKKRRRKNSKAQDGLSTRYHHAPRFGHSIPGTLPRSCARETTGPFANGIQ